MPTCFLSRSSWIKTLSLRALLANRSAKIYTPAAVREFSRIESRTRSFSIDSRVMNSKLRKKSGKASRGATPTKGGASRSCSTNNTSPFDKELNPPYEVYWSKEKVQNGLKRGTLVQGNLTVSYNNYGFSFVSNPVGGPDFMLEGMLARNRALHGDVVVVKILDEVENTKASNMPSDAPSTPSTSRDPPSATPSSSKPPSATPPSSAMPPSSAAVPSPTPSSSAACDLPATTHPSATAPCDPPSTTTPLSTITSQCEHLTLDSTADISMPDGGSAAVVRDSTAGGSGGTLADTLVDRLYHKSERRLGKEEETQNAKQRKAQVVYITEQVHKRATVGTIKAFDKAKKLALLGPRDSRVPRVSIPLAELPPDLPVDFKKYQSTNFVCRIQEWLTSNPFPFGHVMRSLGEAGVVEGETEAILIDNDIDYAEFSEEVNACLPLEQPWTIPKEEVTKRKDFRKDCVFTVDPETARDLDDALHIKKLPEGGYEVGVHIADVSYFVKPDTALDDVASKRATSTYLVHKVIPMLPRLLCENLCSLNPNEDKLSFSVVWQLSSKGEFISEWMGRSIIRSCCKLSYGHAQNMIDGTWDEDGLPPITGGFPANQVADSVVALNNLAIELRKQRKSKGTLRLDQLKLHYTLDNSTGMPVGCEVYPIRASNRMIEEFMLLANMSIARCISNKFPDGAMLRRHPPPRQVVMDELMAKCASLGLQLDSSTAASIQHSLDHCKGREGRPTLTEWEKRAFIIMCVKVMELAVYFSDGVQVRVTPHHYALNVPLYTHFTSPIRRYADIIVHRQLSHALGEGPVFTANPDDVQAQAVQCNKKKKAAKHVGDLSADMFFSIMLKETGPQTFESVVISIQDKSFDVLVKRYGLVRTVYCSQLELKSFEQVRGDGGASELKLVWKSEDKESSKEQIIRVFSEMDVTLSALPKDIFKNKAMIAFQQVL